MTDFEDPSWWRGERREQIRAGRTLGFVPTMGALHEGHLSLVRRSKTESDLTLVSLFVNPTQFDDPTDLAKYPRTLEADLATLETEGTDFVFLPRESDLYPDRYRYRVTETDLSMVMEGASRPGHFNGVLTVVLKLLQIASAERVYFGEKDWQQLALVRGWSRRSLCRPRLSRVPRFARPMVSPSARGIVASGRKTEPERRGSTTLCRPPRPPSPPPVSCVRQASRWTTLKTGTAGGSEPCASVTFAS